MNADRQRQFNVGGARRSSYESDSTAEPDISVLNQLENLSHRPSNSAGLNNRDVNWRYERSQTMPLALGFKHQRPRFRDGPLRSCNTHIAFKQFRLIRRIEKYRFSFQSPKNPLDERRIGYRNAPGPRVINDSLNCDRRFVFSLNDHAAAADAFHCLPKHFEN